MREMIDGLLEYSRVETQGNPFEPVDLNDILADIRRDLGVRIEESDAENTAEDLPRRGLKALVSLSEGSNTPHAGGD